MIKEGDNEFVARKTYVIFVVHQITVQSNAHKRNQEILYKEAEAVAVVVATEEIEAHIEAVIDGIIVAEVEAVVDIEVEIIEEVMVQTTGDNDELADIG